MIKKYILIFFFFFNNILNAEVESNKNNIEETPKVQALPENIFDEARNKVLRWKLNIGDILEIRTKSRQDIFLTSSEDKRSFLEPSEINRDVFYRIVLDTIAKDNEKGYLFEGTFYTFINYAENSFGLYQEDDNQDSTFYIMPRGIFNVPPGNYMPNIRNIPVFPLDSDPANKNPMKEGFVWTYPGTEIMRLDKLESIPLIVKYEYRGIEKVVINKKLRPLHKILYNIEFNHTFSKTTKPENPKLIFGYVTSKLLWDELEGIPYFMTEDYDIVTILNNGQSQEFKINSKTSYKKKHRKTNIEKEKLRKELSETFQDSIKGVNLQVKNNKNGVSIQIPEILFNTDSAELSRESQNILKSIGKVIERLAANNNIAVRGHTDNIGSETYNQKLSEKRALAVANFLVKKFHIPMDLISYEGVGSLYPISDNETPNGRKKNRRVEITILDK